MPNFQGTPSAVLWWEGDSTGSGARLLEGPFGHEGLLGLKGLTWRVASSRLFSQVQATYPFMQVHLNDDTLPISAVIEGSNPLVPGDAQASSWPLADLRYRITNTAVKRCASRCA